MAASDFILSSLNNPPNSSKVIFNGANGQARGLGTTDPIVFAGEYGRVYFQALGQLEGVREAKSTLDPAEQPKYASVPAGKYIDQRAVFQHNRVVVAAPPWGLFAYCYLACKTTPTLSALSFSQGLFEDGYYLEYKFDQNNVFSLNLFEGQDLLEANIAGGTLANLAYVSLRMKVTDEGTQDKIEVFQETAVGSTIWTLLHTETVTNVSPRYRPWGVSAADRNGWAYKNVSGSVDYGSGESTIARYEIDVGDA
jgi:hypothetical protein